MDRLWTNLIVVSNASDAVLNYCGPLDIYIYIIDAFSRKDSLGIIITIAVCFYCERGVYGTRGGGMQSQELGFYGT